MDPLRIALLSAALPPAVGLAALLGTRRFGPGFALAAGAVAGYLALEGVPKGLPVEAWQWLLPGAVLSAFLAFLPWKLRWGGGDALPMLATLTVVASATSACLLLSGTMRIAQLCGALASASGACVLLGRKTEPVLPPAVLLLPGFWWIGYRYADLPVPSALLLAASLIGAGIVEVLKPSWILRISASCIPAAIAVWIAFSRSPSLDY